MHPLIATLANGSSSVWEAATLAVAAIATSRVRAAKPRHVELDGRLLKDIGVEPGSITWM